MGTIESHCLSLHDLPFPSRALMEALAGHDGLGQRFQPGPDIAFPPAPAFGAWQENCLGQGSGVALAHGFG